MGFFSIQITASLCHIHKFQYARDAAAAAGAGEAAAKDVDR